MGSNPILSATNVHCQGRVDAVAMGIESFGSECAVTGRTRGQVGLLGDRGTKPRSVKAEGLEYALLPADHMMGKLLGLRLFL